MVISMYYINSFFIYSILGHFIEGFFYTNSDSGILFGYWTPVYGIGVVSILLIYDFLDKKKDFNKLKGLLIFIIGSIFLSIIEYIGGILIENLFHIVFWDYSSMKYNIGKYTSLEMALVWGICSLVPVYIIRPLIDKLIKKIPKFVTWILIILFIVDLSMTLMLKTI